MRPLFAAWGSVIGERNDPLARAGGLKPARPVGGLLASNGPTEPICVNRRGVPTLIGEPSY
jgi:hypothetical protein